MLAVHAEGDFAWLLGGEGESGNATVAPRHADGDTASGTDTTDGTVFPILRQSRKEVY